MRARLGLLIGCAMVVGTTGCVRDNPAFDGLSETQSGDTLADTAGELPVDTGEASDVGEDCSIASGIDMNIEVPQPCGETNDVLGTYEHWFKVVEAAGSTWSVQFCSEDCLDCEPVPQGLEFSPLPVATIAGPDTCMLLKARRLGTGDDCDYHAITLLDMNGSVLVVARRSESLDIPDLDPATGLAGFEPALVVDESCDCAIAPDSCCGSEAPTLWAYEIDGTQIAVGETAPVTLGQRSYDFWAFDAYSPGECGAPTKLSWALTAQ